MRTGKNYLMLLFKGVAMGAADVVPGVSGGTIAFITGIYQELIDSIRSLDLRALRMLLRLDLKGFWRHINGNFLVAVLGGIVFSIFSLAKLMQYLLDTHPIYIWSFFFGLIIASAWLVSKQIDRWNVKTVLALLLGAAACYTITTVSPASTPDTWWFVVLSGALAICAMILPGISGAFILLLLGKYEYIIGAVSELNAGILALFAVGAVIGIISFSHLLSWLLKNHHNATVALLTGFMIGSLNKIWPWKETLSTFIDRHGMEKVLTERNVLPSVYEQSTGIPAQLGWAILFLILGFGLIWVLEKVAAAMGKPETSSDK